MINDTKTIKCQDCTHFELFGWRYLDGGHCKAGIKPTGDICLWGSREHTCNEFKQQEKAQ